MYKIQKEGVSVPVAVKRCMILRSTAYKFFNEFNADDGIVLPGGSLKKKAIRGIAKKISLEHPSTTLEMARETLIGHFEGLIISFPALWKHSTEQYSFGLKQASEYNAGRDSEITLCIRQELVSKWEKIGVDLQKKKCIY